MKPYVKNIIALLVCILTVFGVAVGVESVSSPTRRGVLTGGQLTGGGGLTKVTHTGGLLSGSGTTANPLAAASPKLGNFGDGSDGTVTFDGSTTVVGYSRSGSIYTATREAFFVNVTINSGVTLNQHSYPGPNVTGTLLNNGHISWDGANASGQTGGPATTSTGPLPIGTSGGNGGNANSNGSNGGPSVSAPRGMSTTSALGATGGAPPGSATAGGACHGAGGGGSLANGGNGGTITLVTTANGDWRTTEVATNGVCIVSGSIQKMTGPTGGGGGAGGGGAGVGGGGGAGASWGVLRVSHFNPAGTGTITAVGGNGDNAAAATGTNQPGGGGGGGGAGGIIVVVTGDSTLPTFNVAGGTHGNGSSGTGTGSAGSNGADGGTCLAPPNNLLFN